MRLRFALRHIVYSLLITLFIIEFFYAFYASASAFYFLNNNVFARWFFFLIRFFNKHFVTRKIEQALFLLRYLSIKQIIIAIKYFIKVRAWQILNN